MTNVIFSPSSIACGGQPAVAAVQGWIFHFADLSAALAIFPGCDTPFVRPLAEKWARLALADTWTMQWFIFERLQGIRPGDIW